MAGIYIHIPFCKQACHYCDFHFSTSTQHVNEMVEAICKEIKLQRNFFDPGTTIETIYFGGGTPSLLKTDAIHKVIETVYTTFTVIKDPEITLEANPDDLVAAKIKELKNTLVNRFSIGVQSFIESELKWMNRAHSVNQAEFAIKASQDAGFNNITIDLIYGLPEQSNKNWEFSLQQAFAMNVPHLSCYCLTVEEKTALHHFIKTGKYTNISDKTGEQHFEILLQEAPKNGFVQYEISNFAKPGFEARHNSNYWKKVPYLGVGPSAHSFINNKRQWNVKNNARYIDALLNQNLVPFEEEQLTLKDAYNEYMMTSLRTIWGCDLNYINTSYGKDIYDYTLSTAGKNLQNNYLILSENMLYLSTKGKFYADKIASDFFLLDEINGS